MDKIAFEEIISILAMHGRPDLISEFKEHAKMDPDYQPPKFMRRDSISDSEGSAIDEDLNYIIDEEGFYSLK